MKLSVIKKIRRTKNKWTFQEVDRLYELYKRAYFGMSSLPSSPRGQRLYLPGTNVPNQNFGMAPAPESPRGPLAGKKSYTPIHEQYSVGQFVEITDTQEQGVIREVRVDGAVNPLNITYLVRIISGPRVDRERTFRGWRLREPLEAASKNY